MLALERIVVNLWKMTCVVVMVRLRKKSRAGAGQYGEFSGKRFSMLVSCRFSVLGNLWKEDPNAGACTKTVGKDPQ